MAAALVALVLVVAAATLVGQALWQGVVGRTWTPLAPATGLAAVLLVADLTVRLPGHAATALAVVGVLALIAFLRVRAAPGLRAPSAAAAGAALLALAVMLVPYVVNHRFGVLGQGLNNDLAAHSRAAEELAYGESAYLIGGGYPLGSHALGALLTPLAGGALPGMLVALAAAAPCAAIAALSMLTRGPWWVRAPAAAAVASPYLVAFYVAQGQAKEVLVALWVTAGALALREVVRRSAWTRAAVPPLAMLLAAPLATYGWRGVAWPLAMAGGAGVVLLAARLVRRRRSRPLGAVLRRPALVAAGAAVLAVPLLAREIPRFGYSPPGAEVGAGGAGAAGGSAAAGAGGGNNLPSLLPSRDVLGASFLPDPRIPDQRLLTWLVVAAFAFALAWAVVALLRRRELVVVGALGGAAAVALYARESLLPYFSAKPLAAMAPLVVLVILAGLSGRGRWRGAAVLAVALAALWSTGVVLRYAPVGPTERAEELERFAPLVGPHAVLVAAHDPYALLHLAPAITYAPRLGGASGSIPVPQRREKPAGRMGFDLDTPEDRIVDRFRWAVTTRTPALSTLPPGWTVAARTRSWVLWRHTPGTTPPRRVLRELDAPGARLDCGTAAGRAIVAAGGIATVRRPVRLFDRWRAAIDQPGPDAGALAVPIAEGGGLVQVLQLPRGRWQLALAATGRTAFRVLVGPNEVRLPADLADLGDLRRVGTIDSDGRPFVVRVGAERLGRWAITAVGAVGKLVATPLPIGAQEIPVRRACGRYVDWIRPAP